MPEGGGPSGEEEHRRAHLNVREEEYHGKDLQDLLGVPQGREAIKKKECLKFEEVNVNESTGGRGRQKQPNTFAERNTLTEKKGGIRRWTVQREA